MKPHVRWETTKAKRRAIDPGFDDPERIAAAEAAINARIVGYRLSEMREAASWSQGEVAAALNVSLDEISRMEDGEADLLSVDRMTAYVAALGGHLRLVGDLGHTSTTFIDYTEQPGGNDRHVA